MNISNIYGIYIKRCSLQNRERKFTPKTFYEIDPWSKSIVVLCWPNVFWPSGFWSKGKKPLNQHILLRMFSSWPADFWPNDGVASVMAIHDHKMLIGEMAFAQKAWKMIPTHNIKIVHLWPSWWPIDVLPNDSHCCVCQAWLPNVFWPSAFWSKGKKPLNQHIIVRMFSCWPNDQLDQLTFGQMMERPV